METLLLSFIVVLFIAVVVFFIVINKCKKDPNGNYSFCKLQSCKDGYVQVGDKCSKKDTSCSGSDSHGVYTKDTSGKCVLSDCVNGWGPNNNSCIKDGTTCTGGTYLHGICRPTQVASSTCEEIDPSVCGSNCILPYPIVEIDNNNQSTFTKSTSPTKNFLQYTTIQETDGNYCKLNTCNTSSTKNQWWCDTNDCDSTVYGTFDKTVHLPDANAYWTYMYTHDDPPGKYCVFQKCKDTYYDDGSKKCVKGSCIEGTTDNNCTTPDDCGDFSMGTPTRQCRNGQWSSCYCG